MWLLLVLPSLLCVVSICCFFWSRWGRSLLPVRVPAQHQERERLVPEEEVEGLEHSLHGMQIGGGGGI